VATDVIRIEVTGTSLTVKKNGSAVIGPITDSAISSGQAGVYGLDGGENKGDNWQADNIGGGGGSTVVKHRVTQ
jgi:hypothetical protein